MESIQKEAKKEEHLPIAAHTHFLESINGPKDIKHFSFAQLRLLAREIRHTIITTIAQTGGHLGGPLGAVELAIALHYVYDSPNDKIVWDTGHQSYPHKLLTGRYKDFHTLRQYKGVCGFCNIRESEHDIFGAGHASTAISAALGMAKARDLKKERHHVIAVVGDGSLTAGLAFEGLNNAGALKSDLLVILNDNRMSISPNVGALSKYLSRMVTYSKYANVRKKAEEFLKSIPGIGEKGAKKALQLEEKLRTLGTPGQLFEELGFRYFGPIDGHDLEALINALKNIGHFKGPVLLHILTEKGKGYPFAETDGDKFHGMTLFDVSNGKKFKKDGPVKYTDAFADALIKAAKNDPKIVAITAAMKSGTGLDAFEKHFPDRFFDVGIAEQHAVTFAAGLAIHGIKPVCAIYSTFLQRAYDQIIHDVCLQNLPVIFAIDRAGLVGDDGPTHNGPFDLAYLRSIPNITIMVPKDENELQHMVYTAANFEKGPIAFRFPRGNGLGVPLDQVSRNLPIGKGELLRAGKDAAIIVIGPLVYDALEAVKESGKNVAVFNARFVKPLDEAAILELAKRTKRLVIVEEGTVKGGLGSAIAELLALHSVHAAVKCIGVPDQFIEHASPNIQKELCGLTKKDILKTIKELVK